jgi:hypothetical protein
MSMTALERVMSRHPKNSFGEIGVDPIRANRVNVNSDVCGFPIRGRIVANREAPPMPATSQDWDNYEESIPQY